ncbi:MAG: hypothetical protein LBV36_01895 [Chromatiales bacterium]|jgi:chain length determinant protein tyrosine kinase EpsG|nr:hypothetical protein [Chromatiales bacterium]
MQNISSQNSVDSIDKAIAKHSEQAAENAIGQILIRQQKLNPRDLSRTLAYAERKRLRFGDSAVKLGLISRQDLEHAVAAQFDYPYLETGAEGYSSKLVTAFEPFGTKGTALRVLQGRLIQQWFAHDHRTLAVVGPSGNDGCSYIAANLAIAFSQQGKDTVLIDANLRKPSLHRLFNRPNTVGLSSALVGRVAIEEVTSPLPLFRSLSLITAGITPPNVYDLFWRPEFTNIVAALRERYSVVLFDAPPYRAQLGSENLAHHAGGALLVIRKNHTRGLDAQALSDAIQNTGAQVVGTVMNRF